jgi:hypothetical protein
MFFAEGRRRSRAVGTNHGKSLDRFHGKRLLIFSFSVSAFAVSPPFS